MMVIHPHGADLVQDIRGHHPELSGQQLCTQVLLDLMVSLSAKWETGSVALLLPLASLIDEVVTGAMNGSDVICPMRLAEQLWALLEGLHDQPDVAVAENLEPSCN